MSIPGTSRGLRRVCLSLPLFLLFAICAAGVKASPVLASRVSQCTIIESDDPPTCSFGGYVGQWYCQVDSTGNPVRTHPIGNLLIRVVNKHGPVDTVRTEPNGRYEFVDLPMPEESEPLCLYAAPIESTSGARISAFDASLVLRYLVAMEALESCPIDTPTGLVYPRQIAADVNCTNMITAYDASLILQHVVRLIPSFPCPEPLVQLQTETCFASCPDGIDVLGITIGDVSGPPAGSAKSVCYVSVDALGRSEHFVDLPILVTGAVGLYSIEFEVKYNSASLEFVSVSPDGFARDYLCMHHIVEDCLIVAMAGAESIEGDGAVCTVRFRTNRSGSMVPGDDVALSRVVFNEGFPEARVVNQNNLPANLVVELGPVAPNPSSGDRVISYRLSTKAPVDLSIYDASGRLIRVLIRDIVSAGGHSASWDGLDMLGTRVSCGVYFCRLRCGEHTATRKLIFIR